jgi:hypothetical protein
MLGKRSDASSAPAVAGDERSFFLADAIKVAVGAEKKLSVGYGGAGVEDARVAPELIVGQQREGRAGIDYEGAALAADIVDLAVAIGGGSVDAAGVW